jgi:hypothetical protein
VKPTRGEFINPKLPKCAVIRPLTDQNADAVAAVTGLTGSGLFMGNQSSFSDCCSSLPWKRIKQGVRPSLTSGPPQPSKALASAGISLDRFKASFAKVSDSCQTNSCMMKF